jgi:hypothetical protein
MDKVDQALQAQVANLQERAGKSLDELFAILRDSGLEKHGQMRDLLKSELGMGHGDANTVAHLFRQQAEEADGDAPIDDVERIYSGPKEALRPIHDAIMKHVNSFGDFDVAPKKTYLSLRRAKQFAMVGPATKTQVEVGLNLADVTGTERLVAQKPGGMVGYKVRLSSPAEVDAELKGWLRKAWEGAG